MDSKVMELLPWYANGTLDEPERSWVTSRLDDHPAYRAQLRFYEQLRHDIQASEPAVEPTAGLDQVMNRIHAAAGIRTPRPARLTTAERQSFWRWLIGDGWNPRAAYGLGLTVIALQAVVIGTLLTSGTDDAYSDTRSRAPAAAAVGPFVKVSFKPGATEADVRFLLVSVGASIVGGPSQLGDYYLYLDAKRTDWAAQQLRTSPIIDNVSVIATLPAAKE